MWAGASLLLLLVAGLVITVRARVGMSEGVTSVCFLCLDHLQGTLLVLILTDVVAQRRVLSMCLALLAALPPLFYVWARFVRLLTVLFRQAPSMQGPSGLAEFCPALMLLRCDPLHYHLRTHIRKAKLFSPECYEYHALGLVGALILSGIVQPQWLLLLAASSPASCSFLTCF
jgi:hypothetical protein